MKILRNPTYANMPLSVDDEVYQVDRHGRVRVSNEAHAHKLMGLSGFTLTEEIADSEVAQAGASLAQPTVSGLVALAHKHGLTSNDLRKAADQMDAESLSVSRVAPLLPSDRQSPPGALVLRQGAPEGMTREGTQPRDQRVLRPPTFPVRPQPTAVSIAQRNLLPPPPQPRVFHRGQTHPPMASSPIPRPPSAQRVVGLPGDIPRNQATQIDPALNVPPVTQ